MKHVKDYLAVPDYFWIIVFLNRLKSFVEEIKISMFQELKYMAKKVSTAIFFFICQTLFILFPKFPTNISIASKNRYVIEAD